MLNVIMPNVIMLVLFCWMSFSALHNETHFAYCGYANCHSNNCRSAQCHYAKCRGASEKRLVSNFFEKDLRFFAFNKNWKIKKSFKKKFKIITAKCKLTVISVNTYKFLATLHLLQSLLLVNYTNMRNFCRVL
jgi:hypothetical protein